MSFAALSQMAQTQNAIGTVQNSLCFYSLVLADFSTDVRFHRVLQITIEHIKNLRAGRIGAHQVFLVGCN